MILQKLWRGYRPPWFTGPLINTFFEAIGALLDNFSQRAVDARIAGIPWAGPGVGIEEPLTSGGNRIECQPDALPYHSSDRRIALYTTEGLQSQRQRLAAFRRLRARRGTHWGAIEHVRPYFADAVAAGYAYPRITIAFQDNEGTPAAVWYSVAPDGTRTALRVSPSNFDIDGRPTYRSRFAVFIDMTGTGYTPGPLWGGFNWGDGTVWGAGGLRPLSTQAQQDIAGMLASWHAAHSWLQWVVLVWPGIGGAAMPSAATVAAQDAAGWWNVPAGAWANLVAADGRGTRPPNFQFILSNPAP